MKLKNIIVMSPSFVHSMEKLIKKELPVKDCFALAKVTKEINEILSVIDSAKKAIVDRFAEKDENGKLKFEEDGRPVFKTEEDKKIFLDELKKLGEEEFDISLKKKIQLPDSITMTVDEIIALEEIVDFSEECS